MKTRTALVALLALSALTAFLPGESRAATINVPADQPTIQAGIDAATNGDTVLVAPGTYYENIDFNGKAITVTSSDGADVTIIDGQQAGSVAVFQSGETNSSVLRGFTIRNGSGTGHDGHNEGGGIFCYQTSSPTIESNKITNNTALQGGGISCATSSSPLINDNTIGNNATPGYFGWGAGVACRDGSSPEITNNRILANAAGYCGGGIASYGSSAPHVANNEIRGNSCDLATGGFGGGICLDTDANVLIEGNLIASNSVGPGHGGGVYASGYGSVHLENNLIRSNSAGGNGGGVYCGTSCDLAGNTIANNSASNAGGVMVWPTATITDCIIWGNTATTNPSIDDQGGTLTVTYSDIEGGWSGTGDIDADPLFVDPSADDYRLQQDPAQTGVSNPCVDTGDPGSTPYAGTTRTDSIADAGIIDMGYHDTEWFPTPTGDTFLGDQEDRSGNSADPVNTATGNFVREETDLSIATRTFPLEVTRFYNSLRTSAGSLGTGWSQGYEIWLDPAAPDSQVTVHWGDGRADSWIDDGAGAYRPSVASLHDTLTANGDGTWTVTTRDLTTYDFDASGRLTVITDKNSNTTTLAYGNGSFPARVTTVTGPVAGRSLTLAYDTNGLLTSVSDFGSPPRSVLYAYDGSGRLATMTDVLGQTITYTYDTSGYLDTITDQRGVTVVTNTYDTLGRVVQQVDGNGNTTTFAYDTPGANQTQISRTVTVDGVPHILQTVHTHSEVFHLLESIEDPLGDLLTYGYDAEGNRTSITDRNGHTTTFTYDERGDVLSATDPDDPLDPNDGGLTTITYDVGTFPDLPVAKTDALGYVTEWTYDASGNMATETRWLDLARTQSVTRSWTYNAFGEKATETDERGNTTQWLYDADGLLTERVNREGHSTWYGHDPYWRRISETDGRGSGPGDPAHTTTYAYDAADRLNQEVGPPVGNPPHGITLGYGYDAIGNRTQFTDGNGNVRTYTFDANSNLVTITEPLGGNPSGRVTSYGYDEIDRRTTRTDPNGHVTTFHYDDADRLTLVEDAAANQWTTTYDAQGNVLSETDPSGVTETYAYDALDRRTLVQDALAHQWINAYDALGHVISQTDPETHQTVFAYDALGRLTSVLDAASGTTTYSYDETGNLTRIEDAAHKIVSQRAYDLENRLTRNTDGLGLFYEYAYDPVGNQTAVTDAKGGTTTLTYDAADRLISILYPDTTSVAYAYDDNDNRTQMTDPIGTSTLTYDEQDRLLSSTDPYLQQVAYAYDPLGNRTSLTYPDGKVVTYAYDAADRLVSVTDWAARVWQYGYDGMRVVSLTFPGGLVETDGYDAAGRLTSKLTEDPVPSTIFQMTWQRDGLGEPTSSSQTGLLEPSLPVSRTTDYRYDAGDRLIDEQTSGAALRAPTAGQAFLKTFSYDANGNLTTWHRGGQTLTLAYDDEDRLVSQTEAGHSVEQRYDGAGNRLARIVDGTATRFVLDRGGPISEVLCETDAGGTITADYIYGLGLLGRVDAGGSLRHYHADDIGNIVALTDETGSVTDRYAYTPFGVSAGREGSTPNPFTYVGALGVSHEANGLYFMRARFYEPDTGRFLGKDPLEGQLDDPLSLHRYLYAGDAPTFMVDPEGMARKTQTGHPRALPQKAALTRRQARAMARQRLRSRGLTGGTVRYRRRVKRIVNRIMSRQAAATTSTSNATPVTSEAHLTPTGSPKALASTLATSGTPATSRSSVRPNRGHATGQNTPRIVKVDARRRSKHAKNAGISHHVRNSDHVRRNKHEKDDSEDRRRGHRDHLPDHIRLRHDL